MTLPERIRSWVEDNFNSKYVDEITWDLIQVAEGSKEGNKFEKQVISKIL